MLLTSVTGKGQITIPKTIRKQLGIRKGCKIQATVVDDHIELHLSDVIHEQPATGFAMLKSNRTAVPADFDSASLFNHDRT